MMIEHIIAVAAIGIVVGLFEVCRKLHLIAEILLEEAEEAE